MPTTAAKPRWPVARPAHRITFTPLARSFPQHARQWPTGLADPVEIHARHELSNRRRGPKSR
eukprot:7045498-Lingulodinium_polyedra.AAC.1